MHIEVDCFANAQPERSRDHSWPGLVLDHCGPDIIIGPGNCPFCPMCILFDMNSIVGSSSMNLFAFRHPLGADRDEVVDKLCQGEHAAAEEQPHEASHLPQQTGHGKGRPLHCKLRVQLPVEQVHVEEIIPAMIKQTHL